MRIITTKYYYYSIGQREAFIRFLHFIHHDRANRGNSVVQSGFLRYPANLSRVSPTEIYFYFSFSRDFPFVAAPRSVIRNGYEGKI